MKGDTKRSHGPGFLTVKTSLPIVSDPFPIFLDPFPEFQTGVSFVAARSCRVGSESLERKDPGDQIIQKAPDIQVR